MLPIIIVLCSIIICLCVSLSMKVGNLAKADEVIRVFFSTTRLMGMYVSCFIMCIAAEATTEAEICSIWKLFRKSTPVSAWKLSLSKYTMILIYMLASIVLAGIYLLADAAISGSPVKTSGITMLALILAALLLLTILLSVGMILTGSSDKGGLLSMGIFMGIFALAFYSIKDKITIGEEADPIENWNIICELSVDIFPYVCIFTAALFIIGFVITALLYKRREK